MHALPARIETERLVLRTWVTTDAPQMSAAVAANLEHLRRWMPWAADEPLAMPDRIVLIEKWQAEHQAGGDTVYGIFLDGVPIGGTGLHRRLGPNVLEIGYWIHHEHVGRGFATEAARALTATAFTITGIDRVEIHHDKANSASGAIPQKLGFTLVGEAPRKPVAPAETDTELQWVITGDEWERRSRSR
jgi:ribosomal-protein-serine acetyltransferase